MAFLVSMQMLLIAIAGIMVLKGRANISFMTVIVGLSSSVIGSMCSAVEAFIERKAGQGVCRKIFEQIEECEENTGETEAAFEDSLALKHISFTYPNAEKPVLENIDISFQKGGLNLSGGERQRISIARAFLQNRKIWIMDEATSNLDKGMAEQIEQTVLDMPDITVIMIAHYCNARTVGRCDEIYKLENKCLNKVENL